MAWWKILVLCITFFSEECACILNGHNASIEDFPYQASLRDEGHHFCGGSIISEKHILTSARCTQSDTFPPPYTGLIVVTGTSLRSKGGNFHRVDKIKVHMNYSKYEDRTLNDIAIITLKDKIVFDKYQQKINLPEHSPKVGLKVIASGWGWTDQIRMKEPDQLQQLQMQLASNKDCQKQVTDPKNRKISTIYDIEICTLDLKGTVCFDDEGGPLAANGVVVGITAWFGGFYCGSRTATVFTNVYKFKNFIETAINDIEVFVNK